MADIPHMRDPTPDNAAMRNNEDILTTAKMGRNVCVPHWKQALNGIFQRFTTWKIFTRNAVISAEKVRTHDTQNIRIE